MDAGYFTGWLYQSGLGGRENIRSAAETGTGYLAGGGADGCISL